MSRLIETIRLEDNNFENLLYHQRRMDRACDEYLKRLKIDLSHVLRLAIKPQTGLFKCRVLYGRTSETIELTPYTVRPVLSLKVVVDDTISYDHKFEERGGNEKNFEKRGQCDDVIIVRKNCVTDASMSNLVFRRGNEWVTSTMPLLKGTQREFLLNRRLITEANISLSDIKRFDAVRLINAMLGFEAQEIPINKVFF